MSLLVIAGLCLIFYVALFTGRKDYQKASTPPPPTPNRPGCRPILIFLLVVAGGGYLLWPSLSSYVTKAIAPVMHPQSTPIHTGQVGSVEGDPDISANVINTVLLQAHSPAQGLGQVLYDEGKQYHIKPSFALAVFHMESDYGTKGVAPTLHSLGNIRNGPDGYRSYATWSDSVTDFYQLISTVYLPKGLTTVAQIIPVYAPATDGNNPTAYVQGVQSDMASWAQV